MAAAFHPPAAHPAPTRDPSPLATLATHGRRGEYALADIARSLNLSHFSIRTIIDKLRTLAKHDAMPLPRTPRIRSGATLRGPLVIYSKSRWDAGEFDAWLDRHHRPARVAVQSVPQPLREQMAARARAIAGVH